MNAKESRNLWRRAQAAKTREERTITAYIKSKHPELYHEAATFYNELNEKYPNKSDLRKVPEFHTLMSRVPVQTPIPKYWKKEYPDININVGSPLNKKFKDNLELRIPLLPNKTAEEDTATTAEQIEADTTTTPDPVQFCEIITDHAGLGATLNEEIHGDIIDKIVADLQKDPELQAFFADTDIDIDIDIDIPENSPLEQELSFW